jgi:hypothetical protein
MGLLHQLPRELGVAAGTQRDRDAGAGTLRKIGARRERQVRGRCADRFVRAREQMEIEERAVDRTLRIGERGGDGELRAAGGRAEDRTVRQFTDALDQDRFGRTRQFRSALAREVGIGSGVLSNRDAPAGVRLAASRRGDTLGTT